MNKINIGGNYYCPTPPPYRHQVEGVELALRWTKSDGCFLLNDDMGTGKTRTALETLSNLVRRDGATRTRSLVVAPYSVRPVWHADANEVCPGLHVILPDGSLPKRIKRIEDAFVSDIKHILFVVNYEALSYKRFSQPMTELDWYCIILDEAHRIRTPGSAVSLAMKRMEKKTRYRAALTGTLMYNTPLDVYGVFRFMAPHKFPPSYKLFQSQYANVRKERKRDRHVKVHPAPGEIKTIGGSRVVWYQGRPREIVSQRSDGCIIVIPGQEYPVVDGYKNLDQMRKIIYSVGRRVMLDDCADIPEMVFTTRSATLSSKGRKVYEEIKEDCKAYLQENTATAPSALTKLLRLQQITGGFIGAEDGSLVDVDDTKAKLLEDALSDIPDDEPVVVFGKFYHDLDVIHQVAKKIGYTSCEMSGRFTKERKEQEDLWQSGQRKIMAIQCDTGGEGVRLQKACYAILYSIGYPYGSFKQTLGRLRRIGQKRKTRFIRLIIENSVDESVYRAIQENGSIIQTVIRDVIGDVK